MESVLHDYPLVGSNTYLDAPPYAEELQPCELNPAGPGCDVLSLALNVQLSCTLSIQSGQINFSCRFLLTEVAFQHVSEYEHSDTASDGNCSALRGLRDDLLTGLRTVVSKISIVERTLNYRLTTFEERLHAASGISQIVRFRMLSSPKAVLRRAILTPGQRKTFVRLPAGDVSPPNAFWIQWMGSDYSHA